MSLLSKDQLAKLIENGKKIENGSDETVPPIVLLRLPNNPPSAWFLASVDPLNHDKAFGLIEIAGDRPELGYVSIKELEDLRGYKNQGVYHDVLYESADRLDINLYARMAKDYGQITLRFTERVTKEDLLKFKS
ncbi:MULTISPECIES: DUF2958 domain-containing protein [Roseivirga]|uniref:DUF2958 domain-containing protein n=1 Tax=Roseivirga spongicola TaxID=333140 RepID=A0A150XEQ2_9BACT|nr:MULTISPECIES: DUF2958 domain-containing protein [Roseivirga]KYG77229.1 hypothetical protein AWW68_00220 [Roseivirga spongicola]MBO6496591.1 DUF2958 domain-containing protein [Roseivirga sp.]MBO6662686.1 DUF2958 domain-containing protein [Roseivirga sp.]MBO6761641.1 DUF2958 domain-containing protein [Roseivirga sp.]MBO6909693.1 DUF2958 domain-containing protein [Roseivirga sp.]